MDMCTHASVGMIVQRDGTFLLGRRLQIPWGIAPPAGHVNTYDFFGQPQESMIFEESARRELLEETGLIALRLSQIWSGVTHFPCRHPGGTWHSWRVYLTEVAPDAQPVANVQETDEMGWYTTEQLTSLALRTDLYNYGGLTRDAWKEQPGLEQTWVKIFRDCGFIA